VFVFCISLSIAAQSSKQPVLRNMVRRLKNISSDDARKMLQQLNLGRDINLLPHNALIVTSESSTDLLKASSLLKVADSEQPYVVATILSAPNPKYLATNGEIEQILGNVSIGTFEVPPSKTEKPKVILDMHNFDLVVIAPKEMIIPITATVKRLQNIPEEAAVIQDRQPETSVTEISLDELLEVLEESKGAVTPKREKTLPVETQGLVEPLEQKEPEAIPVEPVAEGAVEEESDFFSDELFRSLAEAEENAPEPIIATGKPQVEVKPEPVPEVESVVAEPEPEAIPEVIAVEPIKVEPIIAKPEAKPVIAKPEPAPKPEVMVEPVIIPTAEPVVEPTPAAKVEPDVVPEAEEESAQDALLKALKMLAAKEQVQEPVKETPEPVDVAEEPADESPKPTPAAKRPEKKPARKLEKEMPKVQEEPEKTTPAVPTARGEEIDFTKPKEEIPQQYIPTIDGKTGHVELPGSEEELELTVTLPEKVTILE
ncbi:hypothetical protein LCGC14_2540240, partial [marine sediment metagenome]